MVFQCLIRLVTSKVTAGQNRPAEISQYFNALELCFSSAFTFAPCCDPPTLEPGEVNCLMIKLEQTNLIDLSPSSSLVTGFYNSNSIFKSYFRPTSTTRSHDHIPLPPTLKRELVSELRTLFKLESGAFLPRDVDGVLKLYFRRALRILNVSEARIGTAAGQRRLRFFTNSLLMKMPIPPEITQMVSMCTLTPYYREDCLSDLDDLHQTTQDGTAKMELLRSLMPEEFSNFLERVDQDREMFRVHQDFEQKVQDGSLKRDVVFKELSVRMERKERLFHYVQFCRQLQRWASDRSQVLYRTIRGIMYFETALQILVRCDSSKTLLTQYETWSTIFRILLNVEATKDYIYATI